MRHIASAVLIVVSAIAAGCGGIESKIDAACDARADVEQVLEEPIDGEGGTKEDCVRELQAARQRHEKLGRMEEFEKDLDDGTKALKELKERCEAVDPGDC
jgi:hypothetical protein